MGTAIPNCNVLERKNSGGCLLGLFTYSVALQRLELPTSFLFLPLAPWIADNLLGIVYAIGAIDPFRIVLSVIPGCLFSIPMLLILLKSTRSPSSK